MTVNASQLCCSLLAISFAAAAFQVLADEPAAKDEQPKMVRICATAAGRCNEPAVVSGSHRALDLTAPDIRKVMPSEELNKPLPDPNDEEVNVPETVQVKGSSPTPEVPGGILSVFWALWHPTQSWRILAPVQ